MDAILDYRVVTWFMWYLFNKFDKDEAIRVFGDNLGRHIYGKFCNTKNDLYFYSELDNDCRKKLVERAIELYAPKQLNTNKQKEDYEKS